MGAAVDTVAERCLDRELRRGVAGEKNAEALVAVASVLVPLAREAEEVDEKEEIVFAATTWSLE
jgi:hypothetical protein